MKVYLLDRVGSSHPMFYSEAPEVALIEASGGEDGATPERVARGRLDRVARRLWAAVLKAGRRAGPRTRRLLGWLSRRPPPDEPLLRGLRRATIVELHHPALLSLREARREWRHYLARRRRQVLVASLGNWLASLLSLPLVLLPGPNVLGLWFAYRAVTQLLAIRGIWRVETRRILTEFHAEEVLDEPISAPRGEPVDRIAAAFDLKNLTGFLRLSDRLDREQRLANNPFP